MDIGKLNDTTFYDEYEGEGEIILSRSSSTNTESIHIWDGYFEDIFGNPVYHNAGWEGFTKDYQELVRTFDGDEQIPAIAISEYLSDLENYESHEFAYAETRECLMLLISFFKKALNASSEIYVRIQ
jgi:hypothetical protein